jgi:hypothetical protein
MARHGVGSQGWRTVRRPSGEPYCFQTHDAALAALRKHFPALREEYDVRVHVLTDAPGGQSTPTLLLAPTASNVLQPRRLPESLCQS